MTTEKGWFEVDKPGLAKLLEDRGKAYAILELVQNAWDADGATTVSISLVPALGRATWNLIVEDDAPDGFADLTHAYVLFAESEKKGNAEKRGRFNLGEKLVLAICKEASVMSTTGHVVFRPGGTRETLDECRPHGSCFVGVLSMTKVEAEEALAKVRTLIPPLGVTTTINDEKLAQRDPVRVLTVKDLATVIDDGDGNLRKSGRTCAVSLYDPLPGETPTIYEMGIPVVETDLRWHVDVAQKVPLNFDRDNVTPSYLRRLRVEVTNGTHDLLTREDVTSTWVKEAMEDERVEPEALRDVFVKRFGEKTVIHDPSDPEANAIAMSHGYTVIPGGALSKQAWANVKEAELVRPAGQVTPSPKVLTGPDGAPPIEEAKLTPGMRSVMAYARALAEELMGRPITVVVDKGEIWDHWAAAYGGGQLRFNLTKLGHRWFNEPDQGAVDALLIHEFGHETESDHFSHRFIDACCKLGARMRGVTLRVSDFAEETVG